jgi:hypothetical protein
MDQPPAQTFNQQNVQGSQLDDLFENLPPNQTANITNFPLDSLEMREREKY